MKRLLFLVLFLVPFIASAQLSADKNAVPFFPRNKENKGQRFSFFLDYGIFPMAISKTQIAFSYEDESPSPDIISQTVDLEKSSFAKGFSGGFEWQSKRDIIYRLFFGGGKSAGKKTSTTQFIFGAGYAMGGERFQYYPYLDFLMINGDMKLAALQNNTGYIEINKTRFDNSSINTNLTSRFVGFRPSVGGHFFITNRIGVHANAGWLIGKGNGTSSIEFSATGPKDDNGNDTTISATEKLSEKNVTLTVDGKREINRASFFTPNGLSLTIGVTINFVNRLYDVK